MFEGLYKINKNQIQPAADLLSAAFMEDSFYAFLFPIVEQRQKALPMIFKNLVALSQVSNGAFASTQNLEGVMLARYEGENAFSPAFFLRALRIMFRMLGIFRHVSFFKTMKRLSAIKEAGKEMGKYYAKHSQYISLDMIAVAPAFRNQKHMSAMMRAVISEVHRTKTYCLLETETESNIAIYEHFGFRMDKIIEAAEGLTYYFMVYDPYERVKYC